jgi:glycosyltransferase involved in cell wall biosynthesis
MRQRHQEDNRLSILVSINCITYNHEKYIAQAIESFLMQETDFEYEVLIHDDASTDRTASIIRDYACQYPDIIKPIYQTENQYSKGLKVGTVYNLPRAQGKYIAFCEGDDYWIDPLKLQKQINYMEEHPECSMCAHAVKVVKNGNQAAVRFIKPYNETCAVPIEDIIVGGGGFIGINSVVYPKKCMDTPPDFYLRAPVGDVPLELYLATQGRVYYLHEVMSAYRIGVAGSWTSRVASSQEKQIEIRTAMIKMTDEFDRYTDYKYAETVELRQFENELLLLIAAGDVQALKQDKYRKHREKLGLYIALLIYLNKYFPAIYNKLRIYKNFITSKIARQ